MCTPCILQYWCSTNATIQHTSTNQPPTHTNHHHTKAQPIKQVWHFLSQGVRSSDKIQSFYSCDQPHVDLNGENVHWSRAWRGWSVSWHAVCSHKEALGPEIHRQQVDLRERQRLKILLCGWGTIQTPVLKVAVKLTKRKSHGNTVCNILCTIIVDAQTNKRTLNKTGIGIAGLFGGIIHVLL